MTPKEKAEELRDKFDLPTGLMSIERKQCALICVDEILKSSPTEPRQSRIHKISNGTDMVMTDFPALLYWQEVKNEIEKL